MGTVNYCAQMKQLCVLELLSSSDDELELGLKYYTCPENNAKIENYVETVVPLYAESQFVKHFRMSRSTFKKLVEMFRISTFYPKGHRGGKELKCAETHILSFLWFAGNKTVLRSVADRFNCSLSTIHSMIHRVMAFLLFIAPNIIHFPSNYNEKQELANEFQRFVGFPGVIGCIDGTFINIRTPAHKVKSTYVNRYDTTSVTLQGICDHKNRFLDCFTGVPSKVHDARVLRLSFIWPTIQELEPEFHILGDSAYPVTKNILTPYRDYGQLTNVQQNYNYKFCSTRVKIENTFALLKGRFRQLIRTDFHSVIDTSKFIVCCVLHNICIDNEDFVREMHYDENIIDNVNVPINREAGILKRDNIALQLFHE